jgi:hypothetical protein
MVRVSAAILTSLATLSPVSHQAQAAAPLTCTSSIILFSQAGTLGFEIPDAAKNFWGVTIERDENGIGRRSVTDAGTTGGVQPRVGWKRGHEEIKTRSGVASWRYLIGYTLDNAGECVVSSTIAASAQGAGTHAVTVPAVASIEEVRISTVNDGTGIEQVCATWRGTDPIPPASVCSAAGSPVSFSVQKYAEPSNPPITGPAWNVEPVYLEAAQGLRFGCSGTRAEKTRCRVDVRWSLR